MCVNRLFRSCSSDAPGLEPSMCSMSKCRQPTTRISRGTASIPQLHCRYTPNTSFRKAPTRSKDTQQESNSRSSSGSTLRKVANTAAGSYWTRSLFRLLVRERPRKSRKKWKFGEKEPKQVGPCILYHLKRDGVPRRGRAGTVNAQAYPTIAKIAKVAAKPMIVPCLRLVCFHQAS